MKKIVIIIGMLLVMAAIPATAWAGTYSGGSGTSGEPYQIATTDDLIELSNTSGDWSSYFVQTANIAFDADETQVDWDGDGSADWDTEDQQGFSPIGTSSPRFAGSYYGQGHTIANLYINRDSTSYVGLFGYLDGSDISNIDLEDAVVSGNQYVGCLAGYLYGTTDISNCMVTGNVEGSYRVGGVIGYDYMSGMGYIEDSSFYGTVDASASNSGAGGFIGEKSGNSIIQGCDASGTLTAAGRNCGGFVGWIDEGEINHCFTSVDIENSTTTQGRIGGFAGGVSYYEGRSGEINNCYATGDVLVPNLTSSYDGYGIAGFVGGYYDAGDNEVNNSYACGLVSTGYTNSYIGGFSGEPKSSGSPGSGNFWDMETTNQSDSQHSGVSETGKTTAQMKTQSTFTDAGWDFTDTWEMTDGVTYPLLQGLEGQPPIPEWPLIAVFSIGLLALAAFVVYKKRRAVPLAA